MSMSTVWFGSIIGVLAGLCIVGPDASSLKPGNVFEFKELRPILLRGEELSPYHLQRESTYRWPYGERGDKVLVRDGVVQEVSLGGDSYLLVTYCQFPDSEDALSAAGYYSTHMQGTFVEGGPEGQEFGQACWTGPTSEGFGAVLFTRGPYCVLVSSPWSGEAERRAILDIASRVSAKITKQAEYRKGAYSLTRTPPTPTLVQGVDLRALAKHYFGEFEWHREHIIGPSGRQVVLVHPSTDSTIEISVGVYSSVAEAEKHALDYLNSMSSLFQRVDVSELDVGDSGNCWLSEREWGSGIVFVRKNALVSLSIYGGADKRQQIRQIASAIDQSTVAGTMGIKLGGEVPLPAESLPGIERRVRQIEETYKFDEWSSKLKIPGKEIRRLPGLENRLGKYGRLTLSTPPMGDLRSVSLALFPPGADAGRIWISLHVVDSPSAAKEALVQGFAFVTFPGPVYERAGEGEEYDVGDVCFYPTRGKRNGLYYARNNVLVSLKGSDATEPADVLRLAREIDHLFVDSLVDIGAEPPPGKIEQPIKPTGPALPGESRQLIARIDVDRLMGEAVGEQTELSQRRVGRRGVSCLVRHEGQVIGGITIGVFADRETALAIFEEHLLYTSVGPQEQVGGKLGDRGCKWPGRLGEPGPAGRGRVLFSRDNVVISLSLPEDRLEEAATAIDAALIGGRAGVRRGNQVLMPRIVDVDCPEKVVLGARVKVRARVLMPQEAFGDHLAFADRRGIPTGYLVPVDLTRQIEVVRTFQYNAPRGTDQAGEKSFWVCYATAHCVVVSKKVTITVTAE